MILRERLAKEGFSDIDRILILEIIIDHLNVKKTTALDRFDNAEVFFYEKLIEDVAK